jgi:stage V sporulation protein K
MTQHTLTFTLKTMGEKPAEPLTAKAVRQTLPERSYEGVLREIEALIGLEPVKDAIRELAHYTAVQQYRRKAGWKTPSMSLHMAFLGNPGTGKTTIARLLAKLFHRLGVIKEEKFREVSRVNLVGNYVGHTAKDTYAVLEEAKGGVLFIDEAYALVKENPNDFGIEAVETILKYMEDHRNEIIIIFAGYQDQMKKFLKSNPGLASRIPYQLLFPDYETNELIRIARQMAQEYDYRLHELYEKELERICFRERQKENFSNARFVRNKLEASIRKQNARITRQGFTEAELNLLLREDL